MAEGFRNMIQKTSEALSYFHSLGVPIDDFVDEPRESYTALLRRADEHSFFEGTKQTITQFIHRIVDYVNDQNLDHDPRVLASHCANLTELCVYYWGYNAIRETNQEPTLPYRNIYEFLDEQKRKVL